MSQKKPKVPDAPKFQADPLLGSTNEFLSNISRQAASGDFSGDLSFLEGITQTDIDEITGLLETSFAPVFKRQEQDFINQAVAFGQGTTSALTSGLADIANQQAATIAGGALAQQNLAGQNLLNIFGAGIGGLGTSLNASLANQSQINQFNSQNFQNQVAAATLGQSDSGGLFGGLTGALGGAAGGFALGGPIGAFIGGLGGGLAGGFGPAGTGGQLLQAGAGAAAFSNPFGRQKVLDDIKFPNPFDFGAQFPNTTLGRSATFLNPNLGFGLGGLN